MKCAAPPWFGRCRLVLILLIVTAAFGAARPAAAHAPLVRAEPAPGAELRQRPERLFLSFTEPLDRQQSVARLLRSNGTEVAGTTVLAGEPSPVDMLVRLPYDLAPDVYTVAWFTRSAVDGHTRQGTYTFTLLLPDGTRPTAAAQPIQIDAPQAVPVALDVLGKFLGLAGAILLAGTVVYAVLLPLRGSAGSGGPWSAGCFRQVRIGGIAAASLLVLGAVEQLVSAVTPLGGRAALSEVLGDRLGVWLIVRVLAGGLVALALVRWSEPTSCGRRQVMSIAGAGLVLWSFSILSHAAAGAGAGWAVLSDLVHLAAASVWLGTLIHLAISLITARRAFRAREPYMLQVLARFSTVAAVAVGLLLVTGLVNALIQIPTLGALVSTSYGQALIVKLTLAVVLLVIAAGNAWYLRPRVATGQRHARRLAGFQGSVLIEVLAGAAVLGATAALTLLTPARGAIEQQRLVEEAAGQVNPVSAFSGQASLGGRPVSLILVPGRVGTNFIEVEFDNRINTPELTLTLKGPDGRGAAATLRAADSFAGSLEIAGEPGMWQGSLTTPGAMSTARFTIPVQEGQDQRMSRELFGSPAPQVPAVGWALIAVAGGVALVGAMWRPLLARFRSPGLAMVAAEVVGVAVAVVAFVATGDGTRGTESAPGPAWGTTTRVTPRTVGAYTTWQVPSRDGFLMIPAVGPDGRAWVGEMGINKLAALNPAANSYTEFTFPIERLAVTMGAAVDEDNRVWLAQDGTHSLALFDPATGAYQDIPVPTPNSSPFGITIDGQGRVWFTELGGHRLGMYDPATRAFTEYPLPEGYQHPYWLDLAPDGRVWFTTLSTPNLGVLDPATGRIEMFRVPDIDGGTTGIDVAADGTVWFGIGKGRLGRRDPATGEIVTYPLPEGYSYGVAVDPVRGTVWVASTGKAIYSFDPDSESFCKVTTGEGAWWVTLAADGSVWVVEGVEETNALGRFTPQSAAAGCPASTTRAPR